MRFHCGVSSLWLSCKRRLRKSQLCVVNWCIVPKMYLFYFNEGFETAPKQLKAGKRKLLEDMPELQQERNSQYQPGGRGIHRDRDMDDGEEPKQKKKFGEEYKAKVILFCVFHNKIDKRKSRKTSSI